MTTLSPSEARSPVSRESAKPKNPPTPVRPLALAAWAGSEAAPSVRRLEVSTGEAAPADEGKISDVDARGAGSSATSTTATTSTATPAVAAVSHGIPRIPDIDWYMATSPHRQHRTQRTTYTPRVRSTDWAAATAMSAAEPANE